MVPHHTEQPVPRRLGRARDDGEGQRESVILGVAMSLLVVTAAVLIGLFGWNWADPLASVERAAGLLRALLATGLLAEAEQIAAADGTVWVGTENRGIANYDPDKEIWRWYELPIADDLPTAGAVEDILQDRSGRIWVCTRRGFFGWYPDLGEFRRLCEDQGAIWSSYMLDIDEVTHRISMTVMF